MLYYAFTYFNLRRLALWPVVDNKFVWENKVYKETFVCEGRIVKILACPMHPVKKNVSFYLKLLVNCNLFLLLIFTCCVRRHWAEVMISYLHFIKKKVVKPFVFTKHKIVLVSSTQSAYIFCFHKKGSKYQLRWRFNSYFVGIDWWMSVFNDDICTHLWWTKLIGKSTMKQFFSKMIIIDPIDKQ